MSKNIDQRIRIKFRNGADKTGTTHSMMRHIENGRLGVGELASALDISTVSPHGI